MILDSLGFSLPRMKTTKDNVWIARHGTDQVDIANTTFDKLPKDWQAENLAAAKVVEEIIYGTEGEIDLSDEETYNEVGDKIHKAWLERNTWAAGGELDVPFAELPKAEQDKDTDQMKIALEVLKEE